MNDKVFKLPTSFLKSPERLAQLEFDPIQRMVKLYEFIDQQLYDMLNTLNEDGTPRRYSQIAFTSLLQTQQKISNDLLRYGYARVSEAIEINNNHNSVAPLQITLTGVDNFEDLNGSPDDPKTD